MRILLIEPGEVPRPAEIVPTLEGMQSVVGGPIQAVYPFEESVALICHEEGKLLGLPLNRALRYHRVPDVPGNLKMEQLPCHIADGGPHLRCGAFFV